MGYENPLLKLPAAQRLIRLPPDQRAIIEALMREMRADADRLAEQSWEKRKGPMAAYWRAVSTYARHVAHALAKGAGTGGNDGFPASSEAARTPAAETACSHNVQAECTKPDLGHQDSASDPAPDAPVNGLPSGGSR